MPKTRSGRWSLGLIIIMPILFFVGTSLTSFLYQSVPAGNTILEDIANRPALALTMLLAMASGILAFITGLIAIVKQKEEARLVYVAVTLGTLLIIFLLGELIFPH